MNPWYKLLLFVFVVVGPAVVVGISNYTAFPDSFLIATVMLIITVGVSGLFTWKSNQATAKIVRYCLVADIIIALVLVLNMAGHWILAREVSAAKQGVVERHSEEDRQDKRDRERIERETTLAKAQANASYAERGRLLQLPPEQRRDRLAPKPVKKAETAPEPETSSTPEVRAARLTPEQVRDNWWWCLTGLAIAECLASVLAGAILLAVWEWDKNGDGIPDHLQKPKEQEVNWPNQVGK